MKYNGYGENQEGNNENERKPKTNTKPNKNTEKIKGKP